MMDASPTRTSYRGLLPLLAYGAYALPLSFLALPLYILLPDHYARTTGLGLAVIGAMLLLTRLADALWDPVLGRMIDTYARRFGYHWPILLATPLMCMGFAALFLMPGKTQMPLIFLTVGLLCTFLAFSTASIAYQAWGADVAREDKGRAAIVGARELFGLIGMVLAAALPAIWGFERLSLILSFLFFLTALILWRAAPRPHFSSTSAESGGWALPFRRRGFAPLFSIFLCNGMASAITATLMPFFVRDILQSPNWFALYLATYLGAAALAIGGWVRLTEKIGLLGCWRWGMVMAVGGFIWVLFIPDWPSDLRHMAFLAIAALCGVAMGADLVAPPALLAGIIQRHGDAAHHSASYFGLWNFAAKLTLALAAGLALPLLAFLDYVPGKASSNLDALLYTYALLPCILKIMAYVALRHHGRWIAGEV